ncbi:cysteine synthase family protein [Demequina sp. NBRC 110051]|uniref:cysteine synthase family protein n=1 Tax=Demequina sp. NBRC 110051 TaxID=1570340 RepID=UPI00117FDC09|nr:cysteine synthase family protein [Demequina sp. NBRC 110051]
MTTTHHESRTDAMPGLTVHDGYLPTPMTRLARLFPDSAIGLYAKLDQLQISGSTKERTARFLLDDLERAGDLRPGGAVVESTSGNLGMSLARQCSLRGYTFVAVVDERANQAAVATMSAFGARVERVETPADGNRLRARVERVQELLESLPGAVTTHQYGNGANPEAHASTTMPELVASLGAAPDRLYVAMSTTGTILGCQRAIEEHGWHTRFIGVDAAGSALFGGAVADRKLPGLGAGFETVLSRDAHPHAVHRVSEADMIRGCRLLARREGMLTGASTGAIVAAIGHDLEGMRAGESVAMLVHDGGGAYLPTVYDDGWVEREIEGGAAALMDLDEANPFGGRR